MPSTRTFKTIDNKYEMHAHVLFFSLLLAGAVVFSDKGGVSFASSVESKHNSGSDPTGEFPTCWKTFVLIL